MTGRACFKADVMATSIRPVPLPGRPAPARLLKAMKAILVPGLGPPPRADGAKASKRSHLSHRATRTGPGRRGRLRPERRLVLGFSRSLNCGGFAWALTKAAHAVQGLISCASSRPSTADKKSASESPSHRPRAAAAAQHPVAGARDAQTRNHGCSNTKKHRLVAPAQSDPRAAAAAPPHRCGAGRTQRKQAHKKQRGQSRRR